MKLKQVRIQAFRAYQSAENGTFDFTTQTGEPADFVSIYAPNGFGKTSFYDAIEWAYTNNLSRFLRKQSDNFLTAKSERNIAAESGTETGQFILRNKYSPAKLEGFVELATTGKTIKKKLPRARKGQSDFKYDLTETQNSYFLDVLLSQESIDAFLKEVRAEDRYEKFMTYIGDPAAASRYKLLVRLANRNQEHLKQLRNEIRKLRRKLSENTDSEILLKINEKIRLLREQGESLYEITTSFADKDFVDFSGQISERLIFLQNEVKAVRATVKNYLAKASGIEKYIKAKKVVEALEEKLQELAVEADLLNQREKVENELTTLKEKRIGLLGDIRKFEEIKEIFPQYSQTEEEIKNKLIRLRDVESKSKNAETESERINQDLIELEFNLRTLEEKKAELNVQLSEENPFMGFLNDPEITAAENKVLNLQAFFKRAEVDDYSAPPLEFTRKQERASAIEQLQFDMNSRAEHELQVIEINAEVQKRESLNDDLKQLISTGVDLVAKAQLSSCPLCSQDYDSFDKLLSRISDNSVLSDSLKKLFEKKSQFESELAELHNSIKKSKSRIKRDLEKEITRSKRRLAFLAASNIDKQTNEVLANLAELKNKKLDYEKTIEVLRNEIDAINKSLEKHSARKNLSKVTEFFVMYLDKTDISITVLERSFNELKNEASVVQADINALVQKIAEFDIRLRGVDVAKIKGEIASNQSDLDFQAEIVNTFESFLISELNFDLGFLPNDPVQQKKYLRDFFERALGDKKKIVNEKADLIKNFEVVNKLKEDVLPFLESGRIENMIAQLAEQVSAKETVALEIKAERKKLSEFINKQIESFFYEDLINELYRKIDPHPAYRKIEFICDFKSDRPRLEVVASNKENAIIPNLYFSTAQLNILSLSIFLAKALNATDNKGNPVNCIFIDDPIQSMDNINVLSTIDLLRSIVINFDKQIILSTHDDSFHKLLQRKIPEDLFRAKYIELETVGKVKSDKL